MTSIIKNPPSGHLRNAAASPLVVALVYDDLYMFEFACVAEVFGIPRPAIRQTWYRFETCALNRHPVRGQFGAQLVPDAPISRMADAAIVVIPGWREVDMPIPDGILVALREAHANGAVLLSICSGAFVLAATGLLDGKQATTHWLYAPSLQERYPRVRVDPNVLYTDQNRIMTSAGSAAGLDLCLHVVREDFGADTANHLARRMVVAPQRNGGQAQFVERPVPKRMNIGLTEIADRMRGDLTADFPVGHWASAAAMSERTFIRRFKEQFGVPPGVWISNVRIEHARALLESSALPIEIVAQECGFGAAATLRHHFRLRLGTTPTEYRRTFFRTRTKAS